MSGIDIILLVLIVCVLALAVRSCLKKRRTGGGCCGNCAQCSGCGSWKQG